MIKFKTSVDAEFFLQIKGITNLNIDECKE